MKRALFRCENCGDELGVDMVNARVQEPEKCRVCNRRDSLQILHNLCSFTDKQYLKLQELPELVTEGETPSSLTVIAYDGNVDGFRPGDRLELIGIFRAQPGQVDRYKGTLRTLFNTYLDLISFNPLNQQRLGQPRNTTFSDHEKLRFLQFADGPDVLNRLVSSFAPSIFGHDLVKKGILTQLFGGTRKTVPGRGQTRSDINICLIGDPSTAKSQFLQQVHRIAPRSVYTSGRGSSAVGLTAHVRRDP
jgi:DNA replication licensing factor MCM4